jgi:ribosomal protein S9
VNGKNIIDYFGAMPREHSIGPFISTQTAGLYDVWCTVKGGGVLGICSIIVWRDFISVLTRKTFKSSTCS